MEEWFTSDLHLYHTNIIKYCKRPFVSSEEMNSVLIDNWNSVVSPEDTVYFLGDFGLCQKRNRLFDTIELLNGNIIWIVGNHDPKLNVLKSNSPSNVVDVRKDFVKAITPYVVVLLTHKPKASIMVNVCGHVHEKWKIKRKMHLIDEMKIDQLHINVGVDVWDFTPVNIKTIREMICRPGL